MRARDAEALSIIRTLRENGHLAYLVGGCVRDLLLGLQPKDFDVATGATPDEVVALFPGSNLVGAHFGVVVIGLGSGRFVEVATFRSDHAYHDGRRPDGVSFETDPRQDALRRDFTINALFLDPFNEELLDFTGGKADLEARLIRAIGDPERRFQEDHLRLLRAVRFAARLGFEIEPRTMEAIRKMAALVELVAPERIRDELSRILTEGNARRGFELLDSSGLLARILPEIAAMKGVEQPPQYHPEGDVWTHTLIMLAGLPAGIPVALGLGVLLHDVGKPATFRRADRIRFDGHVEAGVAIAHKMLTRFRYPNEEIAQAEALIANHMRFMDVPHMKESTLKRFLRQPLFEQHLELHRLDCSSSHGKLDNFEYVRDRLADQPQEELKPVPLLRGEDLIAAGYKPGPQFSRMLAMVEDAQLEMRVRTQFEAIKLIQEYFPVLQSD